MSKISEMYEKIKEQQYLLVRTKVSESVEVNKGGRQLSKEEQKEYKFTSEELSILTELLEKQGLERDKDFIKLREAGYPDEPTFEMLILKNSEGIIPILVEDWIGIKTMPQITSIEEVEELIKEYFNESNIEELMHKIDNLNLIDIEKLERNEKKETTIEEETVELRDYAYDLRNHRVIDTKKEDVDIDYVHVADLQDVVYNILRNTLIDTKSNAMFNETGNYCGIGQYSDMPGEEEIALVLNSIDRKILDAYFKQYSKDVARFMKMKSKYEEIQELDGEYEYDEELDIDDDEYDDDYYYDYREEFEDSLLRDDVVEYYLSKTPEELEAELGAEVGRMVGFEQKNSHHCYDLWEHTLRTVEGISSESLTPEEFKRLRVAAFFHDIGKPDVSKFNEKTGQQVFYGHAMHSVEVAKPILERLGYSDEEIEQLCFYIGHHDDFISYKSQIAPWMRNHEFMRGINSDTVSEKIIENQYDFKAMGYDDDQIRYICYTLGHDGHEPTFTTKDGPMDIKVDMTEVQEKIDSGEYNSSLVPSKEDYRLLLELCKADASAQSEVAMQQGRVVGSKKEKLENMNNIQSSLEEAYKSVVEKVEGYSFEQFIKDTVQRAYGEKRPMIICKDGTEYSIQASSNHYCSPREDGLDTYKEFEIGNITDWITGNLGYYMNFDEICGNVPKEVIEEIIKAHGGLDKKIMKQRVQEHKAIYEPRDEAFEKWLNQASMGNPFVAQMLRYATRKCDLSKKNEQAKDLLNKYEQQENKDGQTQSDDE